MAKNYGEIGASAKMTFDKSFTRANGQPLDSTEVFYSKAEAEAYAATDVAYVGQKIVVIETVDGTDLGISIRGYLVGIALSVGKRLRRTCVSWHT